MDESLSNLLIFTSILGGGVFLMLFFNVYRDRVYKKLVAETGEAATPLLRTTWGFSVAAVLIGWFGLVSGVLLVISHLKGRVRNRSETELARISLYNTLWGIFALGLTTYLLMGILNSAG